MQNILLLIPIFLFFASIIFRFRDNSYTIFEQNNLLREDTKYVWDVPMKEIQETIQTIENIRVKTQLKKALKMRRLFYYCFILCFVSAFIVAYLNRQG